MTSARQPAPPYKVGDRLYQVVYWSISGRKMETIKIGKINEKTVKVAWFANWTIPRTAINNPAAKDPWFTTRRAAIADTIKRHVAQRGRKDISPDRLETEIRSLQRWLRQQKTRRRA